MSVALMLCLTATTVCFAASPQMGTWNLNEAKSKFGSRMSRNKKVVYEAMGNQIKVTVDGVDAKGKPLHTEWTGKFDGKEYPVTVGPIKR